MGVVSMRAQAAQPSMEEVATQMLLTWELRQPNMEEVVNEGTCVAVAHKSPDIQHSPNSAQQPFAGC
eukprot:scaffold208855_cov15-Tisochrysis_lutea.AAC.1